MILRKKHPNAKYRDFDKLPRICACDLGYVEKCSTVNCATDCENCWNTPLEENK